MNDVYSAREWLTVPDVAERLGLTPSRVRRLIEDRHLAAIRRDGVLQVPSVFLVGDEPLGELRGTLTVLSDNGFSDDEAVQWLLETEDALGAAPIDALLAGRKAEVRRVAQSLA
ncbi:DNA-binding protein [Labedella phragmitis]|uniref:DNA-binding protein n=1 Tax=Labedella phragmitis TaxID=2498849 RepID=A0A444PUR6_9MICO|nr:Rv2175c family DNA-binding protein [Labedella phragmitis]RWZ51602.1 DNA-binding protein [Labedella phragmitis]